MSHALPLNALTSRLRAPVLLTLAALVAAMVVASLRLWPQWRHNPDLSHGLFMPLVFLWLLHEARHGTARYLHDGLASRFALAALLTGALGALCAAGLYAAAVDWSHALVNFMLALSLALFLGAALVVFAHNSARLVPLNWTAIVAVGLWLLSAPIPPGTYSRLTLNLQLWVSEGVLQVLHLLGIAAIRHGNIIELARTSVGVEEACSGIRSLISCVFAGLFFSATLVRRPWARALIVVLAAPLAFAMNFLRSLTLTLLANRGVDIGGAWHDLTGFAVLGVTAAALGGLAVVLERGSPRESAVPESAAPPSRTTGTQWALAAAVGCGVALATLFVTNTRPSVDRDAAVPDLFALLPTTAAGWQVKTTNLYQFSGTLQTDYLAQRNYVRDDPKRPAEIIIYVAYWRAGQAPVSLVASHTPDACWPGSGWSPQRTAQTRAPLVVEGRTVAAAEYRLFQAGERPQHVWFWHLYDGRPITYRAPYSPIELLRLAWRYGFRRDGDQLFVRVSSNLPWNEIAHEPLVAEFFTRTRALGL